MMTINELMTMVGPEEAEEIMDKMVTAAREIVDDLMGSGILTLLWKVHNHRGSFCARLCRQGYHLFQW